MSNGWRRWFALGLRALTFLTVVCAAVGFIAAFVLTLVAL
jgi:hypothetical protein